MTYIDGTKLQKNKDLKSFFLIEDVAPGASFTLTIDMLTPKNEGSYISNWGLLLNKTQSIFCKLSIRIKVVK